MIIWSGHGILIPVFWVMGFFFGSTVGVFLGGEKGGPGTSILLGGLLGCGLVWLYALTFGKPKEAVLLDPQTGQPVHLRRSNTFFFIPAFVWAILTSILAVFLSVAGIGLMVAGPSTPKVQPPGAAELQEAEHLITTKSKGIIHGNTPAAREMALEFSRISDEMRGALIEEGKSPKVSLSGGEFLTYCQVSDHGTAFLVHVPGLRKFTDEAKQVMAEATWFAANQAVAGMNPPPKNLAVGMRGMILYETILLGTPTKDLENDPTGGIVSRHPSHESEVLRPFFTPIPAAEATADKPAQPAAPSPSETPEPKAESPTAEPAVASAPALKPDQPETAAPPAVSPDKPAPTTADEPAPAPSTATSASVTLPTDVREWTSGDGRTMRAALIRFPDPSGAQAEFKREDGQVFTIPLDRFSAETQGELRKIFEGLPKP
jgi:hypothetical protein